MDKNSISQSNKIPVGPISHLALSAMAEKAKQARHDKYLEDSRKRFDQIIKKKMKTTFIGALDSFESNFGYLWGHGLDESKLTHEQREFRAVWDNTRTEVLNKGNTQLRGLQTDLSHHIVSWNRYTINLPVVLPTPKGGSGRGVLPTPKDGSGRGRNKNEFETQEDIGN